jgi:hypothetical protein
LLRNEASMVPKWAVVLPVLAMTTSFLWGKNVKVGGPLVVLVVLGVC